MRISTLSLATVALLALGLSGCEQPEPDIAEPAPVTESGDVPPEESTSQRLTPPENAIAAKAENSVPAEQPGGLEMPDDASLSDIDVPSEIEEPTPAPEPLTIGSPAPSLNIEHWVQLGNGKYEPVSEFEDGKVYVVEFWATWCGPCIASMPHLAEIQKEYADQDVRLVSVSDEPLQTVKDFLEREVRSSSSAAEQEGAEQEGAEQEGAEQEGAEQEETQTYDELTSVYSLTTDPDRSTHTAYMEAANQNGIPTAFIVGKTGQIEWIGHPMQMDEPLQSVVNGDWDRAKFAQQMELQSQIGEAQNLMRRGQMEEGVALVNQLLEEIEEPDMLLGLKFLKLQALLAMQDQGDEMATLASDLLASAQEEPRLVPQLSWFIYQASQANEVPDSLLKDTIAATEEALKEMDADQRPSLLDTLAHLQEAVGNLDAAIATQQEAVDSSEGRMQERLQEYLDELKAAKDGGEEKSAEATAEEADAEAATENEEASAADDSNGSEESDETVTEVPAEDSATEGDAEPQE